MCSIQPWHAIVSYRIRIVLICTKFAFSFTSVAVSFENIEVGKIVSRFSIGQVSMVYRYTVRARECDVEKSNRLPRRMLKHVGLGRVYRGEDFEDILIVRIINIHVREYRTRIDGV